MKLHKLLMGAAIAVCGMAPGLANAELITSWDYTVDARWDNWQPDPGVNQFFDGGDDVLQWGTEADGGLSNLRLTREVDGTIITNSGVAQPGVTVTHNNFAITPPTLTSTDMVVDLTFTPTGTSNGADFTQTFNIEFTETTNLPPCDPQSASVCDDVFLLLNPDDLSVQFQIEDYLYTASLVFDESAFIGGQLFFEDVDGDGNNELYFLTEENFSSILPTGIIITAQQVPEPGALALLGAGVAGLGFAARRRRKA